MPVSSRDRHSQLDGTSMIHGHSEWGRDIASRIQLRTIQHVNKLIKGTMMTIKRYTVTHELIRWATAQQVQEPLSCQQWRGISRSEFTNNWTHSHACSRVTHLLIEALIFSHHCELIWANPTNERRADARVNAYHWYIKYQCLCNVVSYDEN